MRQDTRFSFRNDCLVQEKYSPVSGTCERKREKGLNTGISFLPGRHLAKRAVVLIMIYVLEPVLLYHQSLSVSIFLLSSRSSPFLSNSNSRGEETTADCRDSTDNTHSIIMQVRHPHTLPSFFDYLSKTHICVCMFFSMCSVLPMSIPPPLFFCK